MAKQEAKARLNQSAALLEFGIVPWKMAECVVTSVRLPFPQFKTPDTEDKEGNVIKGGAPVELKWDPRVTEVLTDFLESLPDDEPIEVIQAVPGSWRPKGERNPVLDNAAE